MEGQAMRQDITTLHIATQGQGLVEITDQLQGWVRETAIQAGLLTVFCRHTSASLTIQENADPAVRHDLVAFMHDLAPEDRPYRHASEGPDDMPAHIKSALTDVSLSIPVVNGRAALGTWQGVYLFEHRAHGHRREVLAHLIGA